MSEQEYEEDFCGWCGGVHREGEDCPLTEAFAIDYGEDED